MDNASASDGFKVIVFTCGDLGIEVANRVVQLEGIAAVAVVQAPWRSPKRKLSTLATIRRSYRIAGPVATMRTVLGKLIPSLRPIKPEGPSLSADPGVELVSVDDLHAVSTLERVQGFEPDLGVVAGTYILKEKLFGIPRLGSINLHSGKAPEYRGAAPAFWELYNGDRDVGITIHRVTAKLDSGHILAQETYPLDPAPAGDPIQYVEEYRNDVLRPNGVQMVTEVVAQIAAGTAVDRPQDPTNAKTYRSPDFQAIKELRRRVAVRRGSTTR